MPTRTITVALRRLQLGRPRLRLDMVLHAFRQPSERDGYGVIANAFLDVLEP
jgi:hypothetical protein